MYSYCIDNLLISIKCLIVIYNFCIINILSYRNILLYTIASIGILNLPTSGAPEKLGVSEKTSTVLRTRAAMVFTGCVRKLKSSRLIYCTICYAVLGE